MFGDGLNIGGHLPCAVKKALAGAAAFSNPVWIEPKSWGALPVRLALPAIVTAKKDMTLHKMINTAPSNNLASTSVCSGAIALQLALHGIF